MNGFLRFVSFVLVLGWSVPVLAASDYEDGVKELTKSIIAEAAKFQKQNLAVVDFTDLQGNVTALGRFLAEELSASLVMAGGVQVVDRNQLNKIFQEHSLSMLGISDPAAVKKVGKVAGADALITGSIIEMADSVRVTAKVMATDTARVIAAAKTTIPKTGTIADLIKQGIETPSQKAEEKPAARTPQSAKSLKVEVNQFLFSLQECKKSGQAISCALLITNTGEDREIIVLTRGCGNPDTRMFDSEGNGYVAQAATVGNATGGCTTRMRLISKIPTRAIVSFEQIRSDPQGIAALEISGQFLDSNQWRFFTAQFRDVPLLR